MKKRRKLKIKKKKKKKKPNIKMDKTIKKSDGTELKNMNFINIKALFR